MAWVFFLCMLMCSASTFSQTKKWEGLVYWNYMNMTIFNYDILEHPVQQMASSANGQKINRTYLWFAGDSLVSLIYQNRKGASFGGIMKSSAKFAAPTFIDTPFLLNNNPFLSHQNLSIYINGKPHLTDFSFEKILPGPQGYYKGLQKHYVGTNPILTFRYKFQKNDSVLILAKDNSGKIVDEYHFFKIDPYPYILKKFDLKDPNVFAHLILSQDSLQQTKSQTIKNERIINISANNNSLLVLLNKYSDADSLCIQYRLLKTGNQSDTNWSNVQNKAPIIYFTNFQKGENYRLELRYNLSPHYVTTYLISVEIRWWQMLFAQIIIGFIAGVVTTTCAWLLYKRKKEKQLQLKETKRKQLELQLGAIRAQLNPHFIFNSLGTLQALINQNEVEKANTYLHRVSNLIRRTLETSNTIFTNLADEIEYLRNYLEIENLRLPFKYQITVETKAPVHDIDIPSIFFQPILENAIKHGLSTTSHGYLKIFIAEVFPDIQVVIEDNGQGFNPRTLKKNYGISLTEEKIALLNAMLITKGIEFTIDSIPGKTKCVFKFKNWLL